MGMVALKCEFLLSYTFIVHYLVSKGVDKYGGLLKV